MPDYSKVFVYKICCRDALIEEIYIGSTCNLTRRKNAHKSACNNEANKSFVYQFIRDHGGWDNWDLIMIENFSCNTKMEKDKKERFWIETLKPKLNKNIPAHYQTGEVYDIKEWEKAYYVENIESRKAYRQIFAHCPCCDTMVSFDHRSRHYKTKKHKSNSSSSGSLTNFCD